MCPEAHPSFSNRVFFFIQTIMIKHIVTSFGDVKFAQQERKQCLLGTEHSLLKVSENIGCNRVIKNNCLFSIFAAFV